MMAIATLDHKRGFLSESRLRAVVPGEYPASHLQDKRAMHWLLANGGVLAVLITAGVAVLLVCCLTCSNCARKEKDNLFHRHEV